MSQLLASTIRGQKLGALSYVDGTSAPTHFSNGLPYENDGSVAVAVDGVIDHYHQGLPFTADGRLAVTLSGTPTRFGGGAAPFSASGQLVLGTDVNHYCGGVPFNATSAISSTAGGPPINERYFTQLDGQSKYWRRLAAWTCANPTIEIMFLGATTPSTYFLFDGVDNTDRAYLFSNSTTGYVNSNGALNLNSVAVTTNTTPAVDSKLNKVVVSLTGTYRLAVLGVRFSQNSNFAPVIISSVNLIDPSNPANSFNYPLDKNLAYALADGTTDPLAGSTWEFENGSIDGSDRLLVTEKQDGSGFVGETGINYDYAAGAAPSVDSYSDSYSDSYE